MHFHGFCLIHFLNHYARMKTVLILVAIFSVLMAFVAAVPSSHSLDDCTVENCSKFCQSIGKFGGICIGSYCQCYDF
ncbi:hypothetical protein NQ318_019967 [Aromia moschata]|uniref:Uncharacterized protein n=1 Tax=Aromia moschata TaxID=1265417 RepID=A0AAV8Y7D7_9CUCU|nr:hypothetical protein NQ318_019967 [Aromia moschata]